jgi:hypothetical protein
MPVLLFLYQGSDLILLNTFENTHKEVKHMPRFDRTGPEGTGPRTGWGDGNCPVEPVEEMAQNADTGIPWHLMRHRAFFSRWG